MILHTTNFLLIKLKMIWYPTNFLLIKKHIYIYVCINKLINHHFQTDPYQSKIPSTFSTRSFSVGV